MISLVYRPKEATWQILRWLRIQVQAQASEGEMKEKLEHLIRNSQMITRDLPIQATCPRDLIMAQSEASKRIMELLLVI